MPIAAASLLIGVSFGVIGQPVFGTAGAIVMSAVVFAGSSQFAAAAVLVKGGGVAPAVTAGALLNLRFLPMGVAIAASVRGSALWRAVQGQAIIDLSWAMSAREGGRFDIPYMVGITAANYPAWLGGTVLGVLAGDVIGNPENLGLDALFPAFFLALLWTEISDRPRLLAAVGGAAVAIALVPFVPAGLPIIAATIPAVIVGLARR